MFSLDKFEETDKNKTQLRFTKLNNSQPLQNLRPIKSIYLNSFCQLNQFKIPSTLYERNHFHQLFRWFWGLGCTIKHRLKVSANPGSTIKQINAIIAFLKDPCNVHCYQTLAIRNNSVKTESVTQTVVVTGTHPENYLWASFVNWIRWQTVGWKTKANLRLTSENSYKSMIKFYESVSAR